MDNSAWEASIGAGSGFFGALLTYLGFSSRLKKVEDKFDHVVFKDTCAKCELNQNNQIEAVKASIDKMEKSLASADGKLDQLLLQNATQRKETKR